MDFISFVTVAVSLRSRNLFSAFPSRLGRATPCSVLPDPGHDAVFVRADGIAVVAYNVEDRKMCIPYLTFSCSSVYSETGGFVLLYFFLSRTVQM